MSWCARTVETQGSHPFEPWSYAKGTRWPVSAKRWRKRLNRGALARSLEETKKALPWFREALR